VSDPNGTPTQCSDCGPDWFCDDYGGASLDGCRWTQTTGNWTQGGGVVTCPVAASATLYELDSRVPDISGDFTAAVDVILNTFGSSAGKFSAASLRIDTDDSGNTPYHLAEFYYENGDLRVYRCYHEGSYGGSTETVLSSGTFSIQRSGSTWTYKIGATTIYSASGSTNAVKRIYLTLYDSQASPTLDADFDDFMIST